MWFFPSSVSVPAQECSTGDSIAQSLPWKAALCAQSLTASGKHTPSKSWLRAWKTKRWTKRLFSRILPPSQQEDLLAKWLESLPDFPVNLSASQENEKGMKTNDSCGKTSSESSLNQNHPSLPSRTCQDSEAQNTTNTSFSAYIAGIIDGEGCIGIYQKNCAREEKSYGVRITIEMVDSFLPMANKMMDHYGGHVSVRRRSMVFSNMVAYVITGEKSANLIRDILPFLKIKKAQAILAMKLNEVSMARPAHGKVQRWNKQALEAAKSLREQIATLNKKGPKTSQTDAISVRVGNRWMKIERNLYGEQYSDGSSMIFPKSGAFHSGAIFELPPLEPIIVESAYFSWPTATSTDARRGGQDYLQAQKDRENGQPRILNYDAIQFPPDPWNTPNVPNGGRSIPPGTTFSATGRTLEKNGKKVQLELSHQAESFPAEPWGTPRASDYKGSGQLGDKAQQYRLDRQYLDAQAIDYPSLLPPETTIEDGSAYSALIQLLCQQFGVQTEAEFRAIPKTLNPKFACFLMGWPAHWSSVPIESDSLATV